MQTLKLADDLWCILISGRKGVTIRKGKKDIKIGPLLFEPVAGDDKKVVQVTSVKHKLFSELSSEEVRREGAKDVEELYHAMHRFYPELEMHSDITVIEFE